MRRCGSRCLSTGCLGPCSVKKRAPLWNLRIATSPIPSSLTTAREKAAATAAAVPPSTAATDNTPAASAPASQRGRESGASDFAVDAGLGIQLGHIGFYWALPLSDDEGVMADLIELDAETIDQEQAFEDKVLLM